MNDTQDTGQVSGNISLSCQYTYSIALNRMFFNLMPDKSFLISSSGLRLNTGLSPSAILSQLYQLGTIHSVLEYLLFTLSKEPITEACSH